MARASTEADVGKVLIMIDIFIGAFGILGILVAGSYIRMIVPFGVLFYGIAGTAAVVLLAGVIVSYLAYRAAEADDYHTAGIYAVVAAFLPPIRVVTALGAIMCLISPEASPAPKRRKR